MGRMTRGEGKNDGLIPTKGGDADVPSHSSRAVAGRTRPGVSPEQRISLPYGVAIQHGTRLIVDQGAPATSRFVTCLPPVLPPGGCIADYGATPDLIERLKGGHLLTVQAIHMNGRAISPKFQLADFDGAYAGPPTDRKVYEEQQKKLQEELKRRASAK